MVVAWRDRLKPKTKIRLGIGLGVVLAWVALLSCWFFAQLLHQVHAGPLAPAMYWLYLLVFLADVLCCPIIIGIAGTFFWHDLAADYGQLYRWGETAFNIWLAPLILLTCGLAIPIGPVLLFLTWTGIDWGMRMWLRQFWLEWLDREVPVVKQRRRKDSERP